MGFDRRYRGTVAVARDTGQLRPQSSGRYVRIGVLGHETEASAPRPRSARDQAALLPPLAGRHCLCVGTQGPYAVGPAGYRPERGTGLSIPWLYSRAENHLPRHREIAGWAYAHVAGRADQHRALLASIAGNRRAQRERYRARAGCPAAPADSGTHRGGCAGWGVLERRRRFSAHRLLLGGAAYLHPGI